jgi:hypothetical protein
MVTVLLIKYSNHTDLKYETNSTGMANIVYKINDNKISYNTLYINTSTQSKEEYFYIVDIANDGNGLIRRFNYEKIVY